MGHWQKTVYELNIPVKITYDANGGNGAPEMQKIKKGESADSCRSTNRTPSQ